MSNKTQSLRMFEDPRYDVHEFFDQFFGNLSEKAVDSVRHDLASLTEYCTQEVRRTRMISLPNRMSRAHQARRPGSRSCRPGGAPASSTSSTSHTGAPLHPHNATPRLPPQVQKVVYDNYQLFLEACQGVQDLEEKVHLLRNFVNGSTSLINNLKQTKGFSKQVGPEAGQQQRHVLIAPCSLHHTLTAPGQQCMYS